MTWQPPEEDPSADRVWRWMQRGSVLLVLCGVAFWFRERLLDFWLEAPEEVRPIVVDGVDMRAVHADLIPGWVITKSRGGGEIEARRVAQAVEPFPALHELAGEMHGLGQDGVALRGWQTHWNAALEQVGAPLYIEVGGPSNQPYIKSYEILARGSQPLGGRDATWRVVDRIDHLNVREGDLGHVGDPDLGAVVLAHRVSDAVITDLWLALDPADDDKQRAPFRAALTEWLQRRLPDAAQPLLDSAEARGRMARNIAALEQRSQCSDLRLGRVAWYGLRTTDIQWLRERAREDRGRSCPIATYEEVAELDAARTALRDQAGLRDALEQLASALATKVLLHELQHVADGWAAPEPETGELVCAGCPERLVGSARHEASAYLSSLSSPEYDIVALASICRARGKLGGSHGLAIALVAAGLGEGVCEQPPTDIAARSAALASSWFGRTERIAAPTLPPRLPLD